MGSQQQGNQHLNGGARRRAGDLPYFDKRLPQTPQLKGLGLFIALFGVGLVCAISSSVVWIVAHNYFIVLPTGRRVNIPHGKLDWVPIVSEFGCPCGKLASRIT
jgi:hypothetical protein